MSKVYTLLSAFLMMLCGFAYAEQQTVIFDLGETLIITDDFTASYQTGWACFAAYMLRNPKLLVNPSRAAFAIEKRLFSVLDVIEQRHDDEACTYSPKGFLLPQIMCSWLKGERSCADTRSLIKHALQAHPELCKNDAERALILAMTRMIFTPEIFAKTRKLAPGALDLVQACKEQGYRIAVLSNWDPESFGLVQERFIELFALVDDIVISGDTGVLKPDQRAYQALLQQAQPPLDAHTCIFVDDRPENIEAAQQVGMQGILCPLVNKVPNLVRVGFELSEIADGKTSVAIS